MKKVFLVLLLVLMVGGVVSGAGKIISLPEKNGGLYDYEYTTQLQKGWNLIAFSENFPTSAYQLSSQVGGGVLPSINKALREFYESSSDDEDAPLYAFAYDKLSNDYKQLFPSAEFELPTGDPSAIWVYSKEAGELKHFVPNVKPLSQIQLKSGWNFLAINPEMVSIMFNQKEIAGTCSISESYLFNSESQEWVAYSVSTLINEIDGSDDGDFMGMGWVIKVSNDCTLGGSGSSGVGVPSLPGGSGFPETIGDYLKRSDNDFSPGIADGCNEMGSIGEVCMEVILDSAYDNTAWEETYSVGIMKLTEGFDSFVDSYNSKSEASGNVKKLEEKTIWWASSDNTIILIQNYEVFPDNSMSSSETDGDNPVVQYFVGEYPPALI